MKNSLIVTSIISISAFLTIGCESSTDNKSNTDNHNSTEIIENSNLVKKPDSWINDRVEKAKEKLNSTEGGKLVWQSMEAHGGLENWFNKGVVSFRFDYMPIGGKNAKKVISNIDVWSNRAVLQDVLDPEDSFGWDGENAWEHRNDAEKFPFDVRFWALTPYYFLGQPFIFDGEGVQIEKLADLNLNGKAYNTVKITFEAGTGDAPDDYYINMYDKETNLLKALKYIVSAPSRFKKGEHSPEKTMVLYDLTVVDGIKLPTRYETFKLSELEGELGEKVTDVAVSEIKFLPTIEDSYFEIPEGAELVK